MVCLKLWFVYFVTFLSKLKPPAFPENYYKYVENGIFTIIMRNDRHDRFFSIFQIVCYRFKLFHTDKLHLPHIEHRESSKSDIIQNIIYVMTDTIGFFSSFQIVCYRFKIVYVHKLHLPHIKHREYSKSHILKKIIQNEHKFWFM